MHTALDREKQIQSNVCSNHFNSHLEDAKTVEKTQAPSPHLASPALQSKLPKYSRHPSTLKIFHPDFRREPSRRKFSQALLPNPVILKPQLRTLGPISNP
ncbi:hypothetical protein K402DRAFT_398112 [Aulographum hederae CBS 113979]|uniref:Uncharacterized protein n=1 Tax=Aulographum hederae CBS 113979 TaxID=1176131 RepID=A0A6G1GM71_9PEZI|nr:hypothetical protein K402DRAFT_398112 [Aulographum hederae CBS 113979]